MFKWEDGESAPAEADLKSKAKDSIKNLDPAPGLEELEMGAARIEVDDKKMINCRADLNQLVPFKYSWAWQTYLSACSHHWMPQETNLDHDLIRLESQDFTRDLTPILNHALSYLTFKSSRTRKIGQLLHIYKLITNPECRQYLLKWVFESILSAHSLEYIAESLQLQIGKHLQDLVSSHDCARKTSWAILHTKHLDSTDFKTGEKSSDIEFLLSFIAYTLCDNVIFDSASHLQILSIARSQDMPGLLSIFSKSLTDKELQCNFATSVINQIKAENPHVWSVSTQEAATNLLLQATILEVEYAKQTTPYRHSEVNPVKFEQFLKYQCNDLLTKIGLKPHFPFKTNPMPWTDELIVRPEKPGSEGNSQSQGSLLW